MSHTLRQTQEADLPALQRFFIKAYGEQTAFQSAVFLKWYFAGAADGGLESLIAVAPDGEVSAHYGGLPRTLLLHGQPVSLVWGANAFTLPECRMLGFGRGLVELMMERYSVFGVIGFTPKTADFYHDADFNVFTKDRMHRAVLNLSESSFRLAEMIGRDAAAVRERLPVKSVAIPAPPDGVELREITRAEALTFQWPATSISATIRRDRSDLIYRFFEHPFTRYRCWATVHGNQVITAAFTRKELAGDTGCSVLRSVDLFGDPSCAAALFGAIAHEAARDGISFVDLVSLGALYRPELEAAGFVILENDDTGWLPQVMSPPEARANMEFVGLFSRTHRTAIAGLQTKDVWFTRADSDRDRIARISQVTSAA
jgi:hypothetical protein